VHSFLLHPEVSSQFIPDSAVKGDTEIKRQALQTEGNGPAACSGLQSPVLQRSRGRLAALDQAPSDGIEMVGFYAFAPPGSPLDRTQVILYCGIRVYKKFVNLNHTSIRIVKANCDWEVEKSAKTIYQ
jgi:hypothetical protein